MSKSSNQVRGGTSRQAHAAAAAGAPAPATASVRGVSKFYNAILTHSPPPRSAVAVISRALTDVEQQHYANTSHVAGLLGGERPPHVSPASSHSSGGRPGSSARHTSGGAMVYCATAIGGLPLACTSASHVHGGSSSSHFVASPPFASSSLYDGGAPSALERSYASASARCTNSSSKQVVESDIALAKKRQVFSVDRQFLETARWASVRDDGPLSAAATAAARQFAPSSLTTTPLHQNRTDSDAYTPAVRLLMTTLSHMIALGSLPHVTRLTPKADRVVLTLHAEELLEHVLRADGTSRPSPPSPSAAAAASANAAFVGSAAAADTQAPPATAMLDGSGGGSALVRLIPSVAFHTHCSQALLASTGSLGPVAAAARQREAGGSSSSSGAFDGGSASPSPAVVAAAPFQQFPTIDSDGGGGIRPPPSFGASDRNSGAFLAPSSGSSGGGGASAAAARGMDINIFPVLSTRRVTTSNDVVHSFPDLRAQALGGGGQTFQHVTDSDIVVAFVLPGTTHPIHKVLSSPTYGDHWHHHPYEPTFAEGLYFQVLTGRHSSYMQEFDAQPGDSASGASANSDRAMLIDMKVKTRYCLKYELSTTSGPNVVPFSGSFVQGAYGSLEAPVAMPLAPVQKYHPVDLSEASITAVRSPKEQGKKIERRQLLQQSSAKSASGSGAQHTWGSRLDKAGTGAGATAASSFLQPLVSNDHFFAPLTWPLYELSMEAALFVTAYRKHLHWNQ